MVFTVLPESVAEIITLVIVKEGHQQHHVPILHSAQDRLAVLHAYRTSVLSRVGTTALTVTNVLQVAVILLFAPRTS